MPEMNPLQRLHSLGQSAWLDYIRRDLLESGELARLIAAGEVRGVTSNPTIFQQAIAGSTLYDETARPLAQAGWGSEQVFEALAIEDIRAATDLFLPLYEQSGGADGFVSIEVSPRLAYDTQGTVEEARRLWSEVNRPNVMIKIPATEPGLPAIEQSISEGINVNVTLVFSLARYNQVMQAYLRGLERRQEAGASLDHVASVASFFVSRVDTLVDSRLEHILRGEGPKAPRAAALLGKAAIANAKLAYAQFKAFFEDPRFEALHERGAQLQRPLWASTSTKNPAYRDVVYVETLIGPHTVNTLPPATLESFREHGIAEPNIEHSLSEARAQLEALHELGISMDQVTDQLEAEGVGKFADSFEALLATLEARGEEFRAELGELAPSYREAVRRLGRERVGPRLWQRDPTLWPDPAGTEANKPARFDWLDYATTTREALEGMQPLWAAARADGKRQVGWIGPGRDDGLAEALQAVDTAQTGFQLAVLDSQDPAALRRFARATPSRTSLFVVEQTQQPEIVTQACLEPSWQRVQGAAGEGAGSSFVALAQPDSELADLAAERGFAAVYPVAPASAGPFAALSVGHMLAAELAGLDGRSMLAGAAQMARAAGPAAEPARNPGLALGAFLFCARHRPIELTFEEQLRPFADWAARALREGLGLDAVLRSGSRDGAEGVVRIDLRGEAGGNGTASQQPATVLVMPIPRHARGLGAAAFRWQVGMAGAGALLGRHPFLAFERGWDHARLQRARQSGLRRTESVLPRSQQLADGVAAWPEKRWGKLKPDSGLAGLAEALLRALPAGCSLRLILYPERTRDGRAAADRLRAAIAAHAQQPLEAAGAQGVGGEAAEWQMATLQVVLEQTEGERVSELGFSYGALNRLLAAAEFDALQAERQVVLGLALPPGISLRQLADAVQAAARNA